MTATALVRPIRVGIYTRKSVTDGLEQEFNSLDAQRAAIEAYVQSQAGLGWVALGKRYDDGGFSGATTERPAFQELLRDIEAGRVDVVAVYKIDRLSRSLRDFAKLMDVFERHDVTFTSITQHFSTANSMGRLTLNILMSFAEFERETIAERIRDKVQATRRRGAWTGGYTPLGYDVVNKKLVVNADEARQVRETFALYTQLGTLRDVVAELRTRGWRNKSFVTRRGERVEGREFTKATLHGLLTNVVYRGQVRCRDGAVPGVHEAIVDDALWTAVQDQLRGNRNHGGADVRNKTGALLRGLVTCARCGSAMIHTFTTRGARRHRYYICGRAHNEGVTACPGARIAAGPFERFVTEQLRAIGRDPVLLAKTAASAARLASDAREQVADELRRLDESLRRLGEHDEERTRLEQRRHELQQQADVLGDGTVDAAKLRKALAAFDPIWDELWPRERERIVRLLVERITYHPDGGNVEIELRPCGIDELAKEATA